MKLGITDTAMRDAHQSLLATRMRTADLLPIAEKMDAVGYRSLEVWGGATFDTALRFLKEDPWERLRELKKRITKTPLQMLLRGQNAVGYRHYADDVVERFCELSVANGMDIFRIFDAVNDTRNLETAMRAVKQAGGHAQGTICYTISPVFNADTAVQMARELEQMGADSLCLKDMAGLLDPVTGYEIVSRIKAAVPDLALALHSHCTSGMADMVYIKAIEAGVDSIDTAISSMSHGTSQPPTESLVATVRNTQWDTGLDLELLAEIAEYFSSVRGKYAAYESNIFGVDAAVLIHQMPGGMISNMVNQLREQGAEERLPEVLEEMPRVREDLGFPPLVTPTSQIVGAQAVLNVLLGERYKAVSNEVRQYLAGFYGRPPVPVNPEIQRKVLGDREPITDRPADHIEPELEKARQEIGDLARGDEDVLSFALFPQVARDFFEWRAKGGGPEKEVVAAIAVALAGEQSTNGHTGGHRESAAIAVAGIQSISPVWRIAGRQRAVR
ncbi:MAG: pyruvate carboxylase subunit B [Chloroflexi bacterium]|nr:pyruvate carboxylase subunit B [Chloroflexota bacterium]